eukprot:6195208-Pleurochrysis_carterae.AAC.1
MARRMRASGCSARQTPLRDFRCRSQECSYPAPNSRLSHPQHVTQNEGLSSRTQPFARSHSSNALRGCCAQDCRCRRLETLWALRSTAPSETQMHWTACYQTPSACVDVDDAAKSLPCSSVQACERVVCDLKEAVGSFCGKPRNRSIASIACASRSSY